MAQDEFVKSWFILASVEIDYKFSKEYDTYMYMPVMDHRATELEGRELTLKGYFMPVDMPDGEIVISENSYSSCFFCGGAGPESIVEVKLRSAHSQFKVDEVLIVRGRLKINATDPDHSIFILENAELMTK